MSLLKWFANARRHSGGFTLDGNQHCVGYLSTEIAKRHIDAADTTDQSLFLYLHYVDSHHAYVPPVAWRSRFEDDLPMSIDDAVELALNMSHRLHEHIAAEKPFTDDQWQALGVMYYTAIAYVDHLTGELVDYARTHLDDPIIVVTADHGELFDEQGLLAHMLTTNTAVTNVPLVIDGLRGLSDGLIQHADVMEMLCAELEVEHPVLIGQDIRKDLREFAVTQRGGESS